MAKYVFLMKNKKVYEQKYEPLAKAILTKFTLKD